MIDRLDASELAVLASAFQKIRAGLERRQPDVTSLPRGFTCHVANIGVKDDTDDFVVISRRTTGRRRRRVHAQPVRRTERAHQPRAPRRPDRPGGGRRVEERQRRQRAGRARRRPPNSSTASPLGSAAPPTDVLVASTGVIGRRYPVDRIRDGVAALPSSPTGTSADDAARGIMTTDTVPKVASATIGDGPARVVGIAKGVGMIEPDMATMIAVVLTDAELAPSELEPGLPRRGRHHLQLRQHRHRHLHQRHRRDPRLRCGGHRSTAPAFAAALRSVCLDLTKMIAADGEGAETLIEVTSTRLATRPRPSASPSRSSTRRWSRPRCTAPTRTGGGWRWRSASAATTPTSIPTAS